ncbi:glycosyl hydrolase family 76-domain-containing protein [Talaromyces proteolyticus]|uniref:Glycosyl hydrolase family 76-domain-containing protein n=1 Tax=Talaromyces proteolyticus TaxID=1131652 RepID=A0AAD4PZZ5_9EURO|nr:glycosyl hydrolase family 76-domain-containing protein [Talaromyces proteolyticus]KAH8700309.1 glycosyl hydrolase family 76-domain-containing protein [Talaromyces proteolyticus]
MRRISPPTSTLDSPEQTLKDMISALDIMQGSYFQQWLGTWPDAIDWTAAVIGTQVWGALSALTSTAPDLDLYSSETGFLFEETLAHENLINRFFDQVSAFYFGENAFSLRMQAFDDMLWVVLGWLESIKFQNLHSELHYDSRNFTTFQRSWHGTQLRVPAAHRARVFYELASTGWDSDLCGGGMIWNPYLLPYKNAITNELFISASIGMYLYFTGDPIGSPFLSSGNCQVHDPNHLAAAVRGYQWLKDSNMTGFGGLYADGFHISGYRGIGNPGSKKCDELNTMVYTYNQGVILSGLRGLWLATAEQEYLDDGHELVERVIRATGWYDTDERRWTGLGRDGVLEEICDAHGDCSQDGQTFKGIFFHHLAEFCHFLRPEEERFLLESTTIETSPDKRRELFNEWHLDRCASYRSWIAHNARAALATRNEKGKFGMWWGRLHPTRSAAGLDSSLPYGALDYSNFGQRGKGSDRLVGLLKEIQTDLTKQAGPDEGMATKMDSTLLRNQDDASQSRTMRDVNDRGRGRTVETQSGGLAVVRAWYQWQTSPFLVESR